MKAAASLAYSANKHLEDDDTHVQNYTRNEFIKQGVATWEDFSKWYITPTGEIEEIAQDALTIIVEVDTERNLGVDSSLGSIFNIDWGNGVTEKDTNAAIATFEPGIYEVKITGENIGMLNLDEVGEYMTAIKSWGNIGMTSLESYFTNTNLEYMSVPNENSFKELGNFYIVSDSIQELPDKLFKNCVNLETVILSYPKIKNIPENLFEGVDTSKVTVDISGCTSLENVPDWLK